MFVLADDGVCVAVVLAEVVLFCSAAGVCDLFIVVAVVVGATFCFEVEVLW